ncbi:hypothetical protein CNECB9_1330011 [Cupriavidus necator]|uniref:Uncharacterized protein n=1 Tax=Cupriavidus necator TaxID=106590 RepID=A0A1K0IAB2_CUPNE|nr:hypothetical protein CNECB9_1330011 [Cupriavidus necator]
MHSNTGDVLYHAVRRVHLPIPP